MGQEHINRLVDKTRPAISSEIIGDLLINEASYQCGPHVNMSRLGDPVEGELLPSSFQGANRRCVGLW